MLNGISETHLHLRILGIRRTEEDCQEMDADDRMETAGRRVRARSFDLEQS
jgi:hypothetical protein